MVEVAGRNPDIIDDERTLHEVVITNGGFELIERNGKIGVLHLSRERVAQRTPQPLGAVDVPFVPGREQRIEERQLLDVIPMGVADQDVAAHTVCFGRGESLPERVSTRTAINDDKGSS